MCNRIAGHSVTCEFFKYDEAKGNSSRAKLYNATAVLCGLYKERSFLTFTLPSNEGSKTYQRDIDCPESGDIAVNSKFSKVMEAYSIRRKRSAKKLSYVWVAEAQTKRQQKFGGVGDIHFHVIVNERIKDDRGRVINHRTLEWLQNLWCEHIGVSAQNSLHVDPIPNDVRSVPAYLCKYLGKGAQRSIISRQFGCTRDLSKFKPISIKTLPVDVTLESVQDITTPEGFELTKFYFNSSEVLQLYGGAMRDESLMDSSRMSSDFTTDKILARAHARLRKELYPHGGLSYST